MSQDKHSERRTETRKPVDIFINRFVDGYPYLCRAVDVSRTGMRLRPIHEPFLESAEIGSRKFMGLQFQLPGMDEILTASGEAVFKTNERGEIGVRFTRLPRSARDTIDRFLVAA